MLLPKRAARYLDIFHSDATRGFGTKENCKSGDFFRINNPFLRALGGDFSFGLGHTLASAIPRDHFGEIAVHHVGINPCWADHHASHPLRRPFQCHAARQAQQPGF